MGIFDGFGGGWGGAGMLGLGLAGDAFGAYSNYQQQQRQRDIYNQQMTMARNMQNPAYMLAQAQPYYQANMDAFKAAQPQFERTSINPQIGMAGVSGGAAQNIWSQAMAQQQQQMWQNALQQATGNYGQGLNALQGAGQNVGQPSGQMGGTGNALQSLMLMQALRGGGGGTTPQMGTDTRNLGVSTGGASTNYGNFGTADPSWMSMFGGT